MTKITILKSSIDLDEKIKYLTLVGINVLGQNLVAAHSSITGGLQEINNIKSNSVEITDEEISNQINNRGFYPADYEESQRGVAWEEGFNACWDYIKSKLKS